MRTDTPFGRNAITRQIDADAVDEHNKDKELATGIAATGGQLKCIES